jgi:hypothetical protein
MTPQRLREIAANCEDTSFIASEQNANELRAFADEMESGSGPDRIAVRCSQIVLSLAEKIPDNTPPALVCLKITAAIAREFGVILD